MDRINPQRKQPGSCYIITMKEYLTKWVKVAPIRDCTSTTTTRFLFDHVVTQFGSPKNLISDQSTHFVNQLIDKLSK